MFITFVERVITLCFAHAITDMGLQTEFIGKYKHPMSRFYSQADGKKYNIWPLVSIAHGMINGAGVIICTGSTYLGIAESISHSLIDYGSCTGKYGHWVDQGLHLLTKITWVTIWYLLM